jgi:hypothetical protein
MGKSYTVSQLIFAAALPFFDGWPESRSEAPILVHGVSTWNNVDNVEVQA